jgi:hypothetical protein
VGEGEPQGAEFPLLCQVRRRRAHHLFDVLFEPS